jgi:hypothetical protein
LKGSNLFPIRYKDNKEKYKDCINKSLHEPILINSNVKDLICASVLFKKSLNSNYKLERINKNMYYYNSDQNFMNICLTIWICTLFLFIYLKNK